MVENSGTVRWGTFEFTEDEIERQIDEATRHGDEELRAEPLATAVRFDANSRCVLIELNTGSTLTVPVEWLQGLQTASPRDLESVQILGPGIAIEWPALDQQFSIQGLIQGVFGTRSWMDSLPRNVSESFAASLTSTELCSKAG